DNRAVVFQRGDFDGKPFTLNLGCADPANLCSHSATILAVMLEMPMNKGIHANNESVRAKLLSFSLVAAA
ncbi:hypothetical protein AAAY20_01645, partial [Bacteroides thetaiotaomicron]|uniref:hypothetical protein n=1 Tax=Bacteroides thetaiotaomicron TaxID=818 RepID=UPI0032BF432C